MKRAIVVLFLSLILKPLFSQKLNYYDLVGKDSIKIYFDESGYLTTAENYFFYRVGKMCIYNFSFEGEIKDYSKKNELLFVGNFKDGKLNGNAKIIENGLVIEQGIYKNDKRDSVWTFYKKNRIEKKMDFSNDKIRLCELYSENGENQIKDGLCNYKDRIAKSKFSIKEPIKGKFKNGYMDGEWTYANNLVEYYQDGIFIKGFKKILHSEYFDNPQLPLINFCPSEYVSFYYNLFTCSEKNYFVDTVFFPKYNGSSELDLTFYKSLKDSISQLYKNNHESIYYLVQMNIGKEGSLKSLNIFTPIEVNKSIQLNQIIKSFDKWEAVRNGIRYYEFVLFFPIIIENCNVTIPTYSGDSLPISFKL